ncbi:MAG TPA: hypothetical protein PL033_21220 [Candidatus Brocadiia bacterium]|nr:hypothetical protein [Candidatus Brocadiia bacterium]
MGDEEWKFRPKRWGMPAGIALICLAIALPLHADDLSETQKGAQTMWEKIDHIGPPTLYSPSVERYRFGATDVSNPAFYPIPREPVTRDTYLQWLEEMDLFKVADTPKLGLWGPQRFTPVLVKYVQTGDRRWGEAIVTMLKDWHRATQEEVAKKGWTEQFIEEPAFIPLYRKHLIAGGLMTEDEAWFRELWLFYCRNMHVWGTKPIEWRGGCHRAMPEALSKGLAAKWYPDIPEAEHWKRYAELGFGDFWRNKEVQQNDTGYFPGPIFMLLCCGDQYLGDNRAATDPGMQRIWKRLTVEVTPDGAVNPYGPNGGWNSTAGFRLFALELAAAKTRNGEYRYAAHKVMNYLRYQATPIKGDYYLRDREVGQHVALAWLFADDSVAPVMPSPGSLWNQRIEAIRVPHTDKVVTERLLGNADPDPNKGHICCSWYLTGKEWPDKLVLRSGWNPGDLFALVELHPTSCPANAGGIMGLNRWGTAFTQVVTSKGSTYENRLLVVDVDATAKRRYHPDPLRIDEDWHQGTMPDIRSEVTFFEDRPDATFASVRVKNVDGLPVIYDREFVFVKNRFLATREIVTFEESFKARVAPLWNTRNIGPQIGAHWANTFMGSLVASNGQVEMLSPPADLLVWFAPREDCRLQVVDRLVEDPRALACPAQVRYLWEGTPKVGDMLVFTQVYYPHAPYKPTISSNHAGAKAVYASELQATAGASGIRVMRDDPDVTVLRIEFESGRVQWVAFNPESQLIKVGSLETKENMVYRLSDEP